MSEFWKTVSLYDLEKDGVYYKKEGNELKVVRHVSLDYFWKTCKHRDYYTEDLNKDQYKQYSNIEIPSEVDGMIVTKIEEPRNSYARITNVKLPSTIKTLGENLYYYSNTVFPDSIVDSKYSYIRFCSNIRIPSSVLTIGNIYSCNMVTIPSSVISIQHIDNGESLILKMESNTPPMLVRCDDMNEDDILFVPKGAVESYKKDPQWGKFKNIREDASLGKVFNEVQKEEVKDAPVHPTQDELFALDRLIDAALEDFVVTDEERKILLNKVKAIGMNQDEFTLILNSKIEKRLKEKPVDKPEEKKKGFFARLFGL